MASFGELYPEPSPSVTFPNTASPVIAEVDTVGDTDMVARVGDWSPPLHFTEL